MMPAGKIKAGAAMSDRGDQDIPGWVAWMREPVGRGITNAVLLSVLLVAAKANGFLGPEQPISLGMIVESVAFGVLFGVVMYAYTRWRESRARSKD